MAGLEGAGGDGGIEVELAAVIGNVAEAFELKLEITEWEVGLVLGALHFLQSASASVYFSWRRRRRISGRTAFAAGLFQSLRKPDQRVSSLSWSRSESTPPKTMAPRRPFPTGRASVHSLADCLYQRARLLTGAGAAARAGEPRKWRRVSTERFVRRRVCTVRRWGRRGWPIDRSQALPQWRRVPSI